MRKTIKTLMTAAMFAAALGASTAAPISAEAGIGEAYDPASTGEVFAPVYGPPPMETTTTVQETNVQTVYGPPITTTEPQDTEPVDEFSTTTTVPVVLYGPPWVFYDEGDTNGDSVINTADMTVLRRWILNGFPNELQERAADYNMDGVTDARDLQTLRNFVLGRSTELFVSDPQDVYGPPPTYESTDLPETTRMTSTTQCVYGTPIAKEVIDSDRTTHTRTTTESNKPAAD